MAIGAQISITNELAQVVGCLAERHPDSSVEIRYDTERGEQLWEVHFDRGDEVTAAYLVNDETRETCPIPFDSPPGYTPESMIHA